MKQKKATIPVGKQVTASKTDLFLHCQYPWMPGLDLPRDAGSEASLYGTAFHWLLGGLLSGTLDAKRAKDVYSAEVTATAKKYAVSAPEELEEHVRVSHGMLRRWLKGENDWGLDFFESTASGENGPESIASVEKSIALNPKRYLTDREGGVRNASPVEEKNHVYPDLKPNEIGGTIDLQIDLPRRDLSLLTDHKSGSQAKDFAKPDENAQMLTLATAAPAGSGRILAIFHADRKSLPVMHAQEVTQSQVDTHVIALRKAQRRVGDGSLTPGWWCAKMYCPARTVCPAAQGSIVVAAGEMLAEVVEDVTGELPDAQGKATPGRITAMVRAALEGGLTTAKDVGRFHYFRAEMEKLLEMGNKEMKAWLSEHPDSRPRRPDDKVLVERTRNVERISKEKIRSALGAERAERLFEKLRRQGAMESVEERYWQAAFED